MNVCFFVTVKEESTRLIIKALLLCVSATSFFAMVVVAVCLFGCNTKRLGHTRDGSLRANIEYILQA